MCSLPAHNPCVPFVSYIPGGLQVGTKIKIRGLMHHMSDRFTIDLQCGGGMYMQDDVALHLSVRPSEYAIVRNTYECHSWRSEERYGSCPIVRGQAYDIDIQAEHNRFSIRVNGHPFCDFNHRISMTRVSHIRIAGDTLLHYVGHESGHYGGHCPPVVKPSTPIAPIVGGIIGGILGATIHRPIHSRPHHHSPPSFGHHGHHHHGPHHHGHHGPHHGPHHHGPHHRGGHHC